MKGMNWFSLCPSSSRHGTTAWELKMYQFSLLGCQGIFYSKSFQTQTWGRGGKEVEKWQLIPKTYLNKNTFPYVSHMLLMSIKKLWSFKTESASETVILAKCMHDN